VVAATVVAPKAAPLSTAKRPCLTAKAQKAGATLEATENSKASTKGAADPANQAAAQARDRAATMAAEERDKSEACGLRFPSAPPYALLLRFFIQVPHVGSANMI
jgi:hypothetical protein